MKKNVFFLACFSAFLVACDSATVINPLATVDTGNTDSNSDDSTNADVMTGTDTGTNPGTDGSTDTDDLVDTGQTDASADGGTATTGDTDADGTTTAGTDNGTGTVVNTGTTGFGTNLDGVTNSRTANGIVNSVGLIKLEPVGVTADSSRARFGDLPQPRSDQEIREWYLPPADTCEVIFLNSETVTSDVFIVRDQTATLVSAGDSLVLTDVNGTYATLQQFAAVAGPEYQPEAEINQAAGADLAIDIPGDDFTAFANIAVPPVPALNFSSPAAGANVGVSTFFQWPTTNVPGSVVEIYTSGISTSTNEEIFIGCSVVDDGLFTFPEEVQAQMGPGFDDFWTDALRIVYNVAAEDDTLVFIANSVSSNIN